MRYTNRDCFAALICLAASERKNGRDIGVALYRSSRKGDWKEEIREHADAMKVPIRHYSDENGETYGLDERAGCYGGGVRPVLFASGKSGHGTPRWWLASAGLGPGATNRETFCLIVRAAAEAITEAVTL